MFTPLISMFTLVFTQAASAEHFLSAHLLESVFQAEQVRLVIGLQDFEDFGVLDAPRRCRGAWNPPTARCPSISLYENDEAVGELAYRFPRRLLPKAQRRDANLLALELIYSSALPADQARHLRLVASTMDGFHNGEGDDFLFVEGEGQPRLLLASTGPWGEKPDRAYPGTLRVWLRDAPQPGENLVLWTGGSSDWGLVRLDAAGAVHTVERPDWTPAGAHAIVADETGNGAISIYTAFETVWWFPATGEWLGELDFVEPAEVDEELLDEEDPPSEP